MHVMCKSFNAENTKECAKFANYWLPITGLKPVFSEHNQGAIMHNLNVVAFEEFIEFRTFRSGIKDYALRPKGKNIIKDLSLVIGGEIHNHGMHAGNPGLGVDDRGILDLAGPLADGNYFMIIANQPANSLI